MASPVFKPCMQHQMMLLPPDLSDLIPENSMARLVDGLVDGMDRALLTSLYPGGGASAYDPAMMLKVILLAYASGIYSSRKIAQATRENINFMWICGMHPLEHSTVNRFRTDRIRPIFEEVFTDVVWVLAEGGHITLDTYFLDGTKMEANANRYSFVWKRKVDNYRDALRARVHAHLEAIDEMEDAEEALAPEEPAEIDAEKIREAAERINARLRAKQDRGEKAPELKKAARAIERDWLPRMEKYEHQQEVLAGRGSYSRTDEDATFMRMKDDHMKNGQLKAAYNVQIGTENQFVIASTIHQHRHDTACTIEHLEHVKRTLGHLPQSIVADAGYGSEETYAYLEREGVRALVKHPDFVRDCKEERGAPDEMKVANWPYDPGSDTYTCPEGRTLRFRREDRRSSDRGFEVVARSYICEDCTACSRRTRCTKSTWAGWRKTITVDRRLLDYKRRANGLLRTEEGSLLRKRRGVDVETVFGDIKRNLGFNRFTLRGLEKVGHEWRLIAAGHNIRKLFLAEAKDRMDTEKAMSPA